MILLFVMISDITIGQVPTFKLSDDWDGQYITSLVAVDTTVHNLEPDAIWNRLENSDHRGELFSGFRQEFVWIGFSMKQGEFSDRVLVELKNPQINYVRMFTRHHDENWVDAGGAGRLAPFSDRAIPHINVIYPIEFEPDVSVDVILKLDKRRSSISYPISIWSESRFYAEQQRKYAYFGLYFGFFGIIVLITLIAFLLTLQRIYFWYFSYVLAVGLFVFTDIGLAHQYLYPDSTVIGSHIRMALSYMLLITFNMFTMSYFQTAQIYPHINRMFLVLCGIVVAIAMAHIFITPWVQINVTWILALLYLDILVSIALAIGLSLYHIKIDKLTSLIFITAFSFIFVAGVMFVLTEYAIIISPDFLFSPIQIASVFEILLLSIGLGWQVRRVEKQRTIMNDRVRRLENEKLRAYIHGIEKERNRIATDLHDAIGSKLGQIRRNVQATEGNHQDLEYDLKVLLNDVRDISHELAPPGLTLAGLVHNVERLVLETNQSSDITYSFQAMDVHDRISVDNATALYRIIQEGITNIEKHSRATDADIQLIGHDSEIILTIADNGIGINSSDNNYEGLGLKNMQKRAEAMQGDFSISSHPKSGTEIIITIPL